MATRGRTDLVLNHAADLWQEVLADDAVEMAVLRGGFVLDALRKTDPLRLRVAHQGPAASLAVWGEERQTQVQGDRLPGPALLTPSGMLDGSHLKTGPCLAVKTPTCARGGAVQGGVSLNLALRLTETQTSM